jgi:hypothetical protein
MRLIFTAMVVAISSVSVFRMLPAAAQGSTKLSSVIAGKTIQCGAGSAMYFDPAMRTASVVEGINDTFSVAEYQTAIDPARIKVDNAKRFDIILTTRDGETRLRFERRNGIFLRVGDDKEGDSCVASKGRARFFRIRYDIIREGICGNDPKPSCEEALANRCGPQPTASCVRGFGPRR